MSGYEQPVPKGQSEGEPTKQDSITLHLESSILQINTNWWIYDNRRYRRPYIEAVLSYVKQDTCEDLCLQQRRCENVSLYHSCPFVYRLLNDTGSQAGYVHVQSSDDGLEGSKK